MGDPDDSLQRHWRISGIATALVLAFGAYHHATKEPPKPRDESARCDEDASSHLLGIWDPDVQAELKEHFDPDGSPQAEAAWSRASAALNEQADTWTIGYSTTCDALAKAGGEDYELLWQRLCFQWRLQQMDAVIKFLGQADAASIDASYMPRQLGAIEACESFETAYPELYLPSEVELAREVMAAKSDLAFAEARRVLGRQPDPDAVQTIVEQARALEHDPLTADVLLALAAHLATTDVDRADATLREAIELAKSSQTQLDGYRLAEVRKLVRVARSHATSRPRPAADGPSG